MPELSGLRQRLSHLWKITRLGWFVLYEIGWLFLFANLDLLVGKYGSEQTKTLWERWTHPHWGWKSWVIGALAIALVFLFEGSFRHSLEQKESFAGERRGMDSIHALIIRKIVEEKNKLEGELKALEDEAPKCYLEFSESQAAQFLNYSGLIVRNAGKRKAFKSRLICDLDPKLKVRLSFEDMPIQKIDPEKGEAIRLRTEYLNDDGRWYPIGGTPAGQLDACFERLDANESSELSIYTIPVTIKYTDFQNKEHTTACAIRSERMFLASKRIWCELI